MARVGAVVASPGGRGDRVADQLELSDTGEVIGTWWPLILVGLGAALFTLVSAYGFEDFTGAGGGVSAWSAFGLIDLPPTASTWERTAEDRPISNSVVRRTALSRSRATSPAVRNCAGIPGVRHFLSRATPAPS